MSKATQSRKTPPKMLRTERQGIILDLLKEKGFVAVSELRNRLRTSPMSIHRDLEYLEEAGFLKRMHGGAVRSSTQPDNYTYQEKREFNAIEKRAIGKAAAQLVSEGEVLCLNAGTTTLEVARAVLQTGQNVTLVTSDLCIGMEVANHDSVQLVMTGGARRPHTYALSGPIAESALSGVHFGKAFIGVNGFGLVSGLTTYDLMEAPLVTAMTKKAQSVILVADHTKWNVVALAPIAELKAVDILITDWNIPKDAVEKMHALGIQVIVAPRPETEG